MPVSWLHSTPKIGMMDRDGVYLIFRQTHISILWIIAIIAIKHSCAILTSLLSRLQSGCVHVVSHTVGGPAPELNQLP